MEDPDRIDQHGVRQFVCPICKRPVTISGNDVSKLPKFFPFCSERCKLIDLGAWFDSDYRIAGKPDEESETPSGEDRLSK